MYITEKILTGNKVVQILLSVIHLRSASLELVNIHFSSGKASFCVSTIVLIALPTSPDPPVTKITLVILKRVYYIILYQSKNNTTLTFIKTYLQHSIKIRAKLLWSDIQFEPILSVVRQSWFFFVVWLWLNCFFFF